jgi:hypothetical protein
MPAAFGALAPALVDFEAAAFDAARFGVVPGALVAFGVAAFDDAPAPAFPVDRRVSFGARPIGNAFPTALPALVAAPPTALPALAAAPATTFPAVVAASPTALPAPDVATDSAALPTVPAALPTVFPTFLPTLFRSLAVSGIFVLLIRLLAGGRP